MRFIKVARVAKEVIGGKNNDFLLGEKEENIPIDDIIRIRKWNKSEIDNRFFKDQDLTAVDIVDRSKPDGGKKTIVIAEGEDSFIERLAAFKK
jgi:hypothetical protein